MGIGRAAKQGRQMLSLAGWLIVSMDEGSLSLSFTTSGMSILKYLSPPRFAEKPSSPQLSRHSRRNVSLARVRSHHHLTPRKSKLACINMQRRPAQHSHLSEAPRPLWPIRACELVPTC